MPQNLSVTIPVTGGPHVSVMTLPESTPAESSASQLHQTLAAFAYAPVSPATTSALASGSSASGTPAQDSATTAAANSNVNAQFPQVFPLPRDNDWEEGEERSEKSGSERSDPASDPDDKPENSGSERESSRDLLSPSAPQGIRSLSLIAQAAAEFGAVANSEFVTAAADIPLPESDSGSSA